MLQEPHTAHTQTIVYHFRKTKLNDNHTNWENETLSLDNSDSEDSDFFATVSPLNLFFY